VSPQDAGKPSHREDGTASIELVAVVPFLLLAVLVAAQIALAGHALWSASVASRAGARAALVGRNAVASAREALPPAMRAGSKIDDSGEVSVRVAVPRLLPVLPTVTVGAKTTLAASDG
jgi:hypothetical protein